MAAGTDADLLDDVRGQWDADDPPVLAIDYPGDPVVADVDGTLRLFHDGLVGPVDKTADEVVELLSDADDARVEALSDHSNRFDRDLFEWEVERDGE